MNEAMDPNLLSFIINLASSLSYDLAKLGSGKLTKAAFGDAELQAVERAMGQAFQAMLESATGDLERDEYEHLDGLMRDFVQGEGVREHLLRLVLRNEPADLELLRRRFQEAGYEWGSLEIDFNQAMERFTGRLGEALREEAERPESPLYNKISLLRIDQTERKVEALMELVRGISSLPTDYAGRIRNFLLEYVGTREQPAPMGGRERELAELEAWLWDRNAPPRLLLAAEAGRGKSALLANLARLLANRERVRVVYVPVSVRFNTASESVVFAALAARLGAIYGEPLQMINKTADELRGICLELLSRRPGRMQRIVVILDGVDEAAGWKAGPDLFPGELPKGVRVIVSARLLGGNPGEQGWLRRLGWERPGKARSLRLHPLSREGVSQVLMAMGNPLDRLATRVDMVEEVYRLSQGDPLLVRLYVEALQQTGEQGASIIRPEDLPDIQEGIEGYFQQWEEDQQKLWGEKAPLREKSVQAVLNLLACAYGPLKRDDLVELMQEGGNYSSLDVEEACRTLIRFVIGDGVEQGYAFSHPRLGQHYYGKLGRSERKKWEQRFVEYGKRVLEGLNAGELKPEEAPEYVLRHYGEHLEQVQTEDDALYGLVSEGWMRARYLLEGTYSEFLNDVERAWKRAELNLLQGEKNGMEAIGMQVRCSLCRASVMTLSSNYPEGLLKQSLETGLMTPTQALVITQDKIKINDYSHHLAEIFPFLSVEQRKTAINTISEISDEHWRALKLSSVKSYLTEKLVPELQLLVSTIHMGEPYAIAAKILAPLLDPINRDRLLVEAITKARTIQKKDSKASALSRLIPYLENGIKDTILEEAYQIASELEDKDWQIRIFRWLAPHMGESQKQLVIREALEICLVLPKPELQADALIELAPLLSEDLKLIAVQAGLTAAREIDDPYKRVDSLVNLAQHAEVQDKLDILQEALTAAREIETGRSRVLRFEEIADHLPEEQRRRVVQEALVVVSEITDREEYSEAISDIGRSIPEELKPVILSKAFTVTSEIQDDWTRAILLSNLAVNLPSELKGKALKEALIAVQVIGDTAEQAVLAGELSKYLTIDERRDALQRAVTIARKIHYDRDRVSTLMTLAMPVAENLRIDLHSEALSIARTIQDEHLIGKALCDMARHMPADQSRKLMEEALATLLGIPNDLGRAYALVQEAPKLPMDLKRTALQEALSSTHETDDTYLGGKALGLLISTLDVDQQEEFFDVFMTVISEDKREEFSAELLFRRLFTLQGEEKVNSVHEIIDAARRVKDKVRRGELLSRVISELPEEEKGRVSDEVLYLIREISDEKDQARILKEIVPNLTKEQIVKALATARKIMDEGLRAEVLLGIWAYLPENLKHEVLTKDMLHLSSDTYSQAIDNLSDIIVYWSKTNYREAISFWSNTIRKISFSRRKRFLENLPVLTRTALFFVNEDEQEQLARKFYTTTIEVCDWWP